MPGRLHGYRGHPPDASLVRRRDRPIAHLVTSVTKLRAGRTRASLGSPLVRLKHVLKSYAAQCLVAIFIVISTWIGLVDLGPSGRANGRCDGHRHGYQRRRKYRQAPPSVPPSRPDLGRRTVSNEVRRVVSSRHAFVGELSAICARRHHQGHVLQPRSGMILFVTGRTPRAYTTTR